ncbi:type II restriction endonuclease [Martelella mediterranea]|uniref:EcoRII-like protein n=1 Tax=Martelella mediterranea TaxID=293089 RepID=A0A4R3NDJ2_9HYPH|nr:type II restriction endonuclease [Martelella mediterranea]TCT29604.1 EcoRII-like protein [Martelella mediterranea]
MTAIEELTEQLRKTSKPVFIKVLARNDHIWADRLPGEKGKGKQNGFYVPTEIRESGFFPEQYQRQDIEHIFDTRVPTLWPQEDAPEIHSSNYVHYSNKGSECHFTGIPKELFSGLGPSSLLVMIQPDDRSAADAVWTGLRIPSGTPDYDEAYDLFELPPGFVCGILEPPQQNPNEELAEAILKALVDGTLEQFVSNAALANGKSFAVSTQNAFLLETGLQSFNALSELKKPGDTILRLCDMQYAGYQKLELRLRTAELVQLLNKSRPGILNARDAIHAIVSTFPEILELFKSLRGARASRMGTAFELHIERVLGDTKVPFIAQPKIGNRKPDFLLPSLMKYNDDPASAIVLTAKSTLRERWQQILNEGVGAQLYLATLDRSITDQTLGDMEASGIKIVVPEQFVSRAHKGVPAGVYQGKPSVISFKTFFESL